MTENKDKIVQLLREAKHRESPVTKDERISRRYFFLVLALIPIILIGAVFAYMRLLNDHHELKQSFNKIISDTLQRATELDEEKKYVAAKELYISAKGIKNSYDAEIEAALNKLDDKIQHMEEVKAYKNKLEIRDIMIRKEQYELKVSGKIVNKGNRPVNEIELTIYCLDSTHKPVCDEKITAVSSDGKPLSRYQRRAFSFLRTYDKREFTLAIPAIPASIDDIEIVINDIAFAD